MGKTGAMAIPENVECEGFLVKGGGQDGNKKKKVRYFTMGDGKIAYFDAKTKDKADAKHCKGMFPITEDSSVRDGGKVDGGVEKLPWAQGHSLDITSSGRTFKLFAETAEIQAMWLKATVSQIDFLNARRGADSAFQSELDRFRTACTAITDTLSDAVGRTGNTTTNCAMSIETDVVAATDDICSRLHDVQKKMDVLMTRSLEASKAHSERMLKKFEESVLSSEEREAAAEELESDKAIINSAGDAVMVAERQVRDIVLKMQTTLEQKLTEANEKIASALDTARSTTKLESETMFGILRNEMSQVGQLGGGEPLDTNWWSSFKGEFGFVEELFQAADEDGSGTMSLDELKEALDSSDEFAEKMAASLSGVSIDDIFSAIDSGGDGEISFLEFIKFASAAEFLPHFKSADKDGSGSIDLLELKHVLVAMQFVPLHEADEFVNNAVFAKFDKDGDGGISFDEFATAMQEISSS